MTPGDLEKAIKTTKCPKCGGRLYFRRVLDGSGCTSKECFELFDIYGHSWPYRIHDFTREALLKLLSRLLGDKPQDSMRLAENG